jgi:putative transposase
LREPACANELWTIDYKGQFRTRDGEWCYPLTVVDAHSRYLLGCTAHGGTSYQEARSSLERLFQERGLPQRMRSDNGTPFASSGVGRLSRLNVWWLKLGIVPERIEPGKPQQNGRHERLHRTLKAETARPPAEDRLRQQRRFDRFRHEYNQDRPHEALGQQTPAAAYKEAQRPYRNRFPNRSIRATGNVGGCATTAA